MANVSQDGGSKRLMAEQMSAVESELLWPFNQVGSVTQQGGFYFMTNHVQQQDLIFLPNFLADLHHNSVSDFTVKKVKWIVN